MALSDLIHATEWRGISLAKTMRQFPAYWQNDGLC